MRKAIRDNLNAAEKDIYEPVTSAFLRHWAEEPNQTTLIYIAG
ncbi:hypothetical protein ACX0G9_13010 [Flavitalea flava]